MVRCSRTCARAHGQRRSLLLRRRSDPFGVFFSYVSASTQYIFSLNRHALFAKYHCNYILLRLVLAALSTSPEDNISLCRLGPTYSPPPLGFGVAHWESIIEIATPRCTPVELRTRPVLAYRCELRNLLSASLVTPGDRV